MWVELFLATKSKHLSHPGSTDYANIEGIDIEQDNLCDAWWLTDIDEVSEAHGSSIMGAASGKYLVPRCTYKTANVIPSDEVAHTEINSLDKKLHIQYATS
jgi:hypothetical protein